MISVTALVVLLTAVVTMAVNNRMANLLLRETEARGLAIAHSLGAVTSNALMSYDYLSLRQAAGKAIKEEAIAYVIVLDKEGNLAARATEGEMEGRAPSQTSVPDFRRSRISLPLKS